jgi:hypothetical protein
LFYDYDVLSHLVQYVQGGIFLANAVLLVGYVDEPLTVFST